MTKNITSTLNHFFYRLLFACEKAEISHITFVIYSKMPEREDDHLTPATRLLEKRREMAEVDQALLAQKEVGMICLKKI